MTSRPASRVAALTPSLFFAAFMILAGCATQSNGPIAPISTGDPRVDPQPGDSPHGIIVNEGDVIDDITTPVEQDYTPPHMAGRDIIRAGVMLPFSDRRDSVRAQAEGMLAGIELALFDHAGENFVILPKDTHGTQATAETAARELADQGASFVLGPLFGANVTTARDVLSGREEAEDEGGTLLGFSFGSRDVFEEADEPAESQIPIIAFSNDASVAGGGAWLASVAPEAEVAEIINHAYLAGYDEFAFFGPDTSLGLRIERAMQFEVMNQGAFMVASRFYPSSEPSPGEEAAAFAKAVEAAVKRGSRVAVLVPERGNRLRRIAPLLAYHGVDTRVVKMLGLGTWNDPDIWREPSLKGAWFPAAPQLEMDDFKRRYERLYGREPSSLAAIAYDATALAIALSADGEITTEELTNPDGFAGVNGLFRFGYDGIAERSLEIMEIDPLEEAGVKTIRPVANGFTPSVG